MTSCAIVLLVTLSNSSALHREDSDECLRHKNQWGMGVGYLFQD